METKNLDKLVDKGNLRNRIWCTMQGSINYAKSVQLMNKFPLAVIAQAIVDDLREAGYVDEDIYAAILLSSTEQSLSIITEIKKIVETTNLKEIAENQPKGFFN